MDAVLEKRGADAYTAFGHAVAVLIKVALDATMELDHVKNQSWLSPEEKENVQQLVERCHAAIETLQGNGNLTKPRFILSALSVAEQFMSEFEDDEAQEGIGEMLHLLRVAMGKEASVYAEDEETNMQNAIAAAGCACCNEVVLGPRWMAVDGVEQ